ncbi:Prokaryotic homologs of the JAB domain protein [uncultured archaeon]|nr:Prokaryotic homologs of the JAB domain protein [uncultured archaeon]
MDPVECALFDIRNKDKPIGADFDSIYISKYAFEKAYTYAELACELAGHTIECGGYLICPEDSSDRIARDSFLAREQRVSEGLYVLRPEDVRRAGNEIENLGSKVLGWWHSHGELSTFFSCVDDRGQMTCLNAIAPKYYITKFFETELKNIERTVNGNKIILFDRKKSSRKYELEINDPHVEISGLKIIQEKRVGFSYGLVVNKSETRLPYSEIAVRDLCTVCRQSHDISYIVDVKLFEDGDFKIDRDAIIAELKEKVPALK